MYKGRRALQSYSNDENRIGKYGGSGKRVGSGFKAICDRIVTRSENDDYHDRFALHRVNKLRRLAWWREAEQFRLREFVPFPEDLRQIACSSPRRSLHRGTQGVVNIALEFLEFGLHLPLRYNGYAR